VIPRGIARSPGTIGRAHYDALFGVSRTLGMQCVGYKEMRRNTLQGFADISLASGMIIRDVSIHESHGKRWAATPSKPLIDSERRQVIKAGKPAYVPVVEFVDADTRRRWSDQVLAAVDLFLDGKKPARGGLDEQGNFLGGKHDG